MRKDPIQTVEMLKCDTWYHLQATFNKPRSEDADIGR